MASTSWDGDPEESTMTPPQTQGWLLLDRARLHDQDIVGVMTMTENSLNVKRVEKALLGLVTNDVLQTVDRSGSARRPQAFEAVLEEAEEEEDANHLNEDDESAELYVDDKENFLTTEDVVPDVDDDTALDDEDYHSALFGYREVRDLPNEARVARGFCPFVVPIRPGQAHGQGEGRISKQSWTWQDWQRIKGCWTILRLSWQWQNG